MNKMKIYYAPVKHDLNGVIFRAVPQLVVDQRIDRDVLSELTIPNVDAEIRDGVKVQFMRAIFGELRQSLKIVQAYAQAYRIGGQRLEENVDNALRWIDEFGDNCEFIKGPSASIVDMGERCKQLQAFADTSDKIRRKYGRTLGLIHVHCTVALRKLENRRSRPLKKLCDKIFKACAQVETN